MEDRKFYVAQQDNKIPERFYVYVHRRLPDNLPFYVGKGCGDRAWKFNERNKFWVNVKNKHGVIVEIVFDNLDENTAFQCEKDTILEFSYFGYPLTNLTEGGEGVSGYVRDDEWRRKIRESRRNSEKWREGHRRAALKNTGRKQSSEERKKRADAMRGKKFSPEACANMSKARRSSEKVAEHLSQIGEKQSDKTVYTFYNYSGEIFVGTRYELCKHTGIEAKNIAKLFVKSEKSRRKVVKNWSLSPIQIASPVKSDNLQTSRRSKNRDMRVYEFHHMSGESFIGTRTEFSDYTRISLMKIAALFCKNPSKAIYGWALTPISWGDYRKSKT